MSEKDEAEEEIALTLAEPHYGLAGHLPSLLAQHFPHLAHPLRVYMDYAGGAVPSRRVLEEGMHEATRTVWSNPHSTGELAFASDPSPQVSAVRAALLDLLDATEAYDIVLTQNASHALKLVGETVGWTEHSSMLHAFEAHNSLLGIRELASAAGASVHSFSFYTDVPNAAVLMAEHCPAASAAALFAMPLACNVTGYVAAATDVQSAVAAADKHGRWMVLLDAAGAVGKMEVSCKALGNPHLVAFSLFKAFGWPHLGALLVRRDIAPRLKRHYFGGGTVAAVSATHGALRIDRDAVHERLEDGTLPYLSIMQALPAIALVKTIQPRHIHRHVLVLWRLLCSRLSALRHASGTPLVCFHRALPQLSIDDEAARQCGVLCLNFLRPNGDPVPLDEVAERAVAAGMQLRVGGFCNPGAMERIVGVPPARAALAAQHGARCGLGALLSPPQLLGAVRLSLGMSSSLRDVTRLLRWAHSSFSVISPPRPLSTPEPGISALRLADIFVYPVKSGGAFRVCEPWPVLSTGLFADRYWMIVERASLRPLSQKQLPALALIRPHIDLAANSLTLTHPAALTGPLVLSLSPPSNSSSLPLRSGTHVTHCPEADAWLSCLAPSPLMLVRREEHSAPRMARNRLHSTPVKTSPHEANIERLPTPLTDSPPSDVLSAPLSLANESQFLVVSNASIVELNSRLASPVSALRFRPNFVLHGGAPYAEDRWSALQLGSLALKSIGSCGRCTMINIDQESALMGTEPLNTLSRYRRSPQGNVIFGAHFVRASCAPQVYLEAGMPVIAYDQQTLQ